MSTSRVAARDRNEFWRAAMCRTFVELDITPNIDGPIRGAIRTRQFGPLRATRIVTDPMTAARTRNNLATSREDRFLVALQLRGHTFGSQDGREVSLGAGEFALFDSARPYTVDFQGDGFDHLVFHIPRDALTRTGVDGRRDTARVFGSGSRSDQLVANYLLNLSRLDETVSDADRIAYGAMAVELLGASLRPAAEFADTIDPLELAARMKTFARSQISSPSLSPTIVSEIHGISVRQLHRIFALTDSSFGAWLREQRLTRCFADLQNPDLAHLTIAQVSARYGIVDPAVFSRTFRRRFGLSPSEVRSASH